MRKIWTKEKIKKGLKVESAMLITSTLLLLVINVLVFIINVNDLTKVILLMISWFYFLVALIYSMYVERKTGMYECIRCHSIYTPKLSRYIFSINLATSRLLRCPYCKQRSWHEKVYLEENNPKI
jgi:DNA-directed RNA polymerase subunit RPC12/RpoP